MFKELANDDKKETIETKADVVSEKEDDLLIDMRLEASQDLASVNTSSQKIESS